VEAGQAKEATDLGSQQSGIFFRRRLDDPNRIERFQEKTFSDMEADDGLAAFRKDTCRRSALGLTEVRIIRL
jgi:hypothetical protein